MPPRFLIAVPLALGAGVCSSCASSSDKVIPELTEEPWRLTRKGTSAVSLNLGVGSDYSVDSTVAVVGANFGEPSQLYGDMIGRYGIGVQFEHFVLDDWMMFIGGDHRVFEPDLGDPNITFGEASQTEYFLGTRYYLPMRWLDSQRLRPFLQSKLTHIPTVKFDMTTRLEFDPPLNDAVMVAPYSGSDYWSLGAGGGLTYQFTDSLLLSWGFFYEWPLGTSEGRSKSELVEATGNEFVDNLLDGLEYDVEIKPQGWIAYLNLSYAF
jgi:hypothetical protein